jgi:hypothetical protein
MATSLSFSWSAAQFSILIRLKLDQKQLRDLEPDLLLALIVQAFAVQALRKKCENSHKDFVRSRPQTVHGQTVDRVLSIRSFS